MPTAKPWTTYKKGSGIQTLHSGIKILCTKSVWNRPKLLCHIWPMHVLKPIYIYIYTRASRIKTIIKNYAKLKFLNTKKYCFRSGIYRLAATFPLQDNDTRLGGNTSVCNCTTRVCLSYSIIGAHCSICYCKPARVGRAPPYNEPVAIQQFRARQRAWPGGRAIPKEHYWAAITYEIAK